MHFAVDLSRIADTPFRDEVERALVALGHETRGTVDAPRDPGRSPERLVVMADLSKLAAAYSKSGWSAWRECFPSMSPLQVVFVRHRDEEHWRHLVDAMMRASGCRLWVYKVRPASVKQDLRACLAEFTAHLDPEAVLDVRYSASDRMVRFEFADGARRSVPWPALELPALHPPLRPETIRVGENPEIIEILDGDGDVYDFSASRIRSLVAQGPAVAPREISMRPRAVVG